MGPRVKALEDGQKAILDKLDAISRSIGDGRLENEKRFSGMSDRFGAVDTVLAKLETRLDHTADAAGLARMHGELTGKMENVSGRVTSIPTTWQTVAIIVGMLGGISAIAFAISKLMH
ncbi:hypothetical protein FV232_00820 [Methylobacterium sp. WL30]|uniref:hypothetical protein n=1 Tax=unclassified Methylobacterium TaxID=2615210 RepID=UPI0011CA64D0|nr:MULTISPECIES: hypothetical protein [unclassified Methylobacterium]TXN40503.1 hypothetical protein FV225_06025 [Methylobacterium sp. WL93]TXN52288.1 hypothetical protein FV227_04350 [Methylobacterium sp. WL119]TXN70629.1 hypothetical protein FV232_00820 [Methylobacterium sp. WL30]